MTSVLTDGIDNVVKIVHHPGEDKPWVLDYHDVSVLQTARAAINYPVTEFKHREDAEEVAEMVRGIIHADAVYVVNGNDDILEVLHNQHSTEFFEPIHRVDEGDTEEQQGWDAVNSLSEDEIRANQERQGRVLDTDRYVSEPGPSESLVEKEFDQGQP